MFARIKKDKNVWVIDLLPPAIRRRLPFDLIPESLRTKILILENGGLLQDGSSKVCDEFFIYLDEAEVSELTGAKLGTGLALFVRKVLALIGNRG